MAEIKDFVIFILITLLLCLAAALFNECFVKSFRNPKVICDIQEEINKCEINIIATLIQLEEIRTKESSEKASTEARKTNNERTAPHIFLRSRIVDKSNVSFNLNKNTTVN